MRLAQLLVPLLPTTMLPHDVLAAVDLAALAEHGHAVRILVLDGEVVVDVAVAVAAAHLPAAEAGHGADGMRAEDPVHDVQVVDVLLDDVVAGEPGEVVPVAELPLHVAPARLAVDDPDLPAVPVALGVEDLADRAVVDALDRLAVARVVPALRAGGDAEALSAASSPARITRRTPGTSTAAGFSMKTCLPASIAAIRCCGRKCGGVARMT